MKIVIATDSFKGCLTSLEAGHAIESGVTDALGAGAVTDVVAIADGGEGTIEALKSDNRAVRHVKCRGPLGDQITAEYLIEPDTATAYIEIANICGLTMIGTPTPDTALRASSEGVADVIADAIGHHGARKIIVGLGGSATTDAGERMIAKLRNGPVCHLIESVDFTIMTDVDNPLLGPDGAAAVFSPQKGALPDTVAMLESRLTRLALTAPEHFAHTPGAGAAGGLGWAFMAHFGANRTSGIEAVLDHTGFDNHVADASIVFTGEGRIDVTSLAGKAISGVIRRTRKAAGHCCIIALGGFVSDTARKALESLGVKAVDINPPGRPIYESLRHDVAVRSLRKATADILLSQQLQSEG